MPVRRLSFVVGCASLVALATLAGCGGGGEDPPATPAPSSTSGATTAATASAPPSASPTTATTTSAAPGSTALDAQARAALVPTGSFASFGYPTGQDLASTGAPSTSRVCGRTLAVDSSGQHATASRAWQGATYQVHNATHVYGSGSASEAVSQLRAAVGSCTTYQVANAGENATFTIAAPVTAPVHYGIDASYAYCETVRLGTATAQNAVCRVVFANGRVLSMLTVQSTTDSTSDTFAELNRLADTAATVLQSV